MPAYDSMTVEEDDPPPDLLDPSERYVLRKDAERLVWGAGPCRQCAAPVCPFCRTAMTRAESPGDAAIATHGLDYLLVCCDRCRYWAFRVYDDPFPNSCMPPPSHGIALAKAAEYFEKLPPGCDAEIAAHVRRHPNLLRTADPTHFERFVADVFRANHRHAEVVHVGGPGDGGRDIYLVNDSGNRWLISVKRRGRTRPAEPVDTVRDLLGTLVLEGERRGIVVSSADRFSPAAVEAASKARVRGFRVELVDGGLLDRMLDPVLPDRPWLEPLRRFSPELVNELDRRLPGGTSPGLFDAGPRHIVWPPA